jgi:hypothetical protein
VNLKVRIKGLWQNIWEWKITQFFLKVKIKFKIFIGKKHILSYYNYYFYFRMEDSLDINNNGHIYIIKKKNNWPYLL